MTKAKASTFNAEVWTLEAKAKAWTLKSKIKDNVLSCKILKTKVCPQGLHH